MPQSDTLILITLTVASGAVVFNISIDYSLPTTPKIANPVLLILLLLMRQLSLIYQLITHCLLPLSFDTLILSNSPVANETAVFICQGIIHCVLPLSLSTQYY